jgi:hypothetical protein
MTWVLSRPPTKKSGFLCQSIDGDGAHLNAMRVATSMLL